TGRLNKAFNFLKTITKYHEFKRGDGSIRNKVKKLNGTVVTDQNTVNKLILDHLKTVQTSQTELVYVTATFPSLEAHSPNEINYILKGHWRQSNSIRRNVRYYIYPSQQTNNHREDSYYMEK